MNNRKSPDRPIHVGERRRTFTDAEGIFWDVREMKLSDYDRRGGHCLIFESVNIVRRIRDYPPEWHEMPEAALALLCQGL